MKNTFSVRGGTPVVNGVPIRQVLECKVESIQSTTTASIKFDIPNDYRFVQREAVTFDFGFALEALRQGKRARRKGWNGKDMYIFLANGDDLTSCICSEDMPPCTDSICIKTADDKICVGWLASQTDMLAEDWTVVE